MKKINIFMVATAVIVSAVACTEEKTEMGGGAVSGEAIGIGEIEISSPATKAGGISKVSKIIEEDGISLTVTGTIEPMDASIDTKATEITRANLSSFFVDGYLGKEIKEKAGATAADIANQHFINGVEAVYSTGNTGNREGEGYIGGWAFRTQQQWRDQINHYFWAYTPKVTFDSQSADAASFTYTTNYTDDLLLAHHQQYWESGHCKHTNTAITDALYDELGRDKPLHFDHLLSEVTVTANVTADPTAAATGDYILLQQKDANGGILNHFFTVDKDGKPTTTPRGEITSIQLLDFKTGEWDSVEGWEIPNQKINFSTIESGVSKFVIPQPIAISSGKSSNSAPTETTKEYSAIQINFKDNQLQTDPFRIFGFPTALTAGQVTEWLAGYKQSYIYKGAVTFPYVPAGQEGYDPSFAGGHKEIAMPYGSIDFTHVKTINLSWEVMPKCQSNGQQLYIAISPTEIDYTNQKWKNNSDIYINKVNDDSISDFDKVFGINGATGDPGVKILYLVEGQNTFSFTNMGQNTYIKTTTDTEFKAVDYTKKYNDLNASMRIENINVENLSGVQTIYFGYSGGNNGKAEWLLKNLHIEIVEYM